MKKNISYFEDIKTSPLAKLSMASKELFHSNMLDWIFKEHPSIFMDMLNLMGIQCETPNSSEREWHHFDFCLKDSGGNVVLLLENKVKSLPNLEQLEKYSKDEVILSNTTKVLLSLVNESVIPQKEEIENSGWIIRSYEDLGQALHSAITKPKEELCSYHYALLEDYCKYICALSKLAAFWTCDEHTTFEKINKPDDIAEIIKMGLNDVRQKLLYQQIAEIIRRKVQANDWNTENCGIADFFKGEKKKTLDICYGITRSVGLVEVKWKLSDQVVFGIQVQGEQYRHLVEWRQKPNEKEIQKYLATPFLAKATFDYPQKTGKEYNQYGDTFIYRYRKINPNDTAETILSDIEKFAK